MINLKITFEMDGQGVMFSPSEPPHLDSLLAWTLARLKGMPMTDGAKDMPIQEMSLPLASICCDGVRIWCASAILPEGETSEEIIHWRKHFRIDRAEIMDGTPNTTNGKYKDWNYPCVLTLCNRMVAYCVAYERRNILHLLKKVTHIGKKAAHGHGKVCGLKVEEVDYDWSLVRDGVAMRYLPDHKNGWKLVRPRPPYWNTNDRTLCIVPGDRVDCDPRKFYQAID